MDKMAGYHAYPSGGKWAVRKTGAMKALKLYASRMEAWKHARRLARGSETAAWLHDKTGRIITMNDYRKETTNG